MTGIANTKATIVHPQDLGPLEQDLWRTFARESSLGSAFLSWAFAEAVGRVRGDARVAVFDEGTGASGFLAFQVGPEGAGRPIGATICDAQAVIAPPTWTFDAQELIRAAGLQRWAFDHLTLDQSPFAPYHRQRHRCPAVDLSVGYEAFIQEVRTQSKDLLAQVARRRRKLEREVGPVRFEWHSSELDADLRTLRQWKSAQYARDGTWDRFAEPWIAETLALLAHSVDPSCAGILSTLRAGDHVAAVHFGLLGHDRLSWWFPAYDPALGRYSPGLILLLELCAEAVGRGIPVLDLGRGEHGYKLRVTPHFYEVAEGEVVVDGR